MEFTPYASTRDSLLHGLDNTCILREENLIWIANTQIQVKIEYQQRALTAETT